MKLLFVTNTPWDRNLGAARVYVELADELSSLGHSIERFSSEDAFPGSRDTAGAPRSLLSRLWNAAAAANRSFSLQARAFLCANAHRFDVVDAGHTELPYSKAELGFGGLLVARSVALTPAYWRFEEAAARRWPEPRSLRSLAHRALFYPRRRQTLRNWKPAMRYADLVNVSNEDDRRELAESVGLGDKVVCLPFGLTEARARAFQECRASVAERLAAQTVAFIGTWNTRKGARDWPEIVRRVRDRLPETRFVLLGTDMKPEAVLRDFSPPDRAAVEVATRFDSDELPRLLSRVTVGAFPGYLEGFGFAVLEKLAAGLPVVAYDAPGPREMLKHQSLPTTVPPGDVEGFARLLTDLLTSDAERYGLHSADSTAIAGRFRWRAIARQTAELYEDRLRAAGSSQAALQA